MTLHLAGIPWDSKLVAVFTWPLKVSSSSLYPVSGSFLYILLLSRMKTTVGLSSGGTQNFLDLNSLRFLCTLKVEFIFKCMILFFSSISSNTCLRALSAYVFKSVS